MTNVQSAAESDVLAATSPSRRRPRRHLFRVVPLVLAILAVLAIAAGLSLDIGTLTEPGAGMWPLAVAAVLGVTAALLVFVDIPADYENWDRRTLVTALGVVTLAVFIGVLPVLGFLLDAVVLLMVWLRGFARESWRFSVLLAVVGGLALYLLFATVLGVPLPDGVLLPTGLLKG